MSAEQRSPRWTAVEDARLAELWPTHTLAQLADVFDRTAYGCFQRAYKLGLPTAGRWGEARRAQRAADATEISDAPPEPSPVAVNGHADTPPAVVSSVVYAPERPVVVSSVIVPPVDVPPLDVPPARLVVADPSVTTTPEGAPDGDLDDALDAALATVARLARDQVAALTRRQEDLLALTERQAGLIASYQAVLGGQMPGYIDEVALKRLMAERDIARADLATVREKLGEVLDERDQLAAQLAAAPAATTPASGDTSQYEAELRRAWLVIAWCRKAIGSGRAIRALAVPDERALERVADQLAEAGRRAAEGEAATHG